MLTRLKISGFKNLVDVDVRFGPFTCVAGANGVGKSNLFDAIRFLSALADRPVIEAAMSVRSDKDSGRAVDIRSLFTRQGDSYLQRMSFIAEMVIPAEGEDDLGQKAEAATTLVRYSLVLGYREDNDQGLNGILEILSEDLSPLRISDFRKQLAFLPSGITWKGTVIRYTRRRSKPFISTEGRGSERLIRLHLDGTKGRPMSRRAVDLPRTIISATNAAENPTACLVRREMRSWQLLQLQPSALRRPDEFNAPTKLGSDGSHLPATLFRLASHNGIHGKDNHEIHRARVYAQVADRLAELIEDVHNIKVDRDERREILTVFVTGRDQTPHAAKALSDGTLRFLALAVLVQDSHTEGVLCLEEPENGIHPARVQAMISLLQDLATDPEEAVGPDNPLRQVIVNTHSPSVVQLVPDDSLLVAEQREIIESGLGDPIKGVLFSYLPDTWRATKTQEPSTCPKGKLLDYLNPVPDKSWEDQPSSSSISRTKKSRRVVDRFHPMFSFMESSE